MFSFKNLINKYSKVPAFLLRSSEGHYDYTKGGVWVEGIAEEISIDGAVVPMTARDVQYLKFDEGGTYSIEDWKLYTYTKIEKGEKVKYKNDTYTVLGRKDYSDFESDLFVYYMKRVDV